MTQQTPAERIRALPLPRPHYSDILHGHAGAPHGDLFSVGQVRALLTAAAALADEAQASAPPAQVTPAMIDACLAANVEYWRAVEADPTKRGTVREAAECSLIAALGVGMVDEGQAEPIEPTSCPDPEGCLALGCNQNPDGSLCHRWRPAAQEPVRAALAELVESARAGIVGMKSIVPIHPDGGTWPVAFENGYDLGHYNGKHGALNHLLHALDDIAALSTPPVQSAQAEPAAPYSDEWLLKRGREAQGLIRSLPADLQAGFAIASATLLAAPSQAGPSCTGDPGECAFNGACMYRCGRFDQQAEPRAEQQYIAWVRGCMRDAGLCIDGGKCHHKCDPEGACFRRDGFVPLSGSGLADNWQFPAVPSQAEPAPLLTDEQLTAIYREVFGLIDSRPVGKTLEFIRSIERAVRRGA